MGIRLFELSNILNVCVIFCFYDYNFYACNMIDWEQLIIKFNQFWGVWDYKEYWPLVILQVLVSMACIEFIFIIAFCVFIYFRGY